LVLDISDEWSQVSEFELDLESIACSCYVSIVVSLKNQNKGVTSHHVALVNNNYESCEAAALASALINKATCCFHISFER